MALAPAGSTATLSAAGCAVSKSRDYRAEYRRRIARGLERGFTRSQARGHPKPREALIHLVHRTASARRPAPTRKPSVKFDRQLEAGLQALRSGGSLTQSAHSVHVSPERLRRYALRSGTLRHQGSRWLPRSDKRPRQMLVYSNGEAIVVTVKPAVARHIGEYMSAVGHFLDTNSPAPLATFHEKSFTDAAGKRHPFETDPNTLYQLADTGSATFEDVYRIVA